MSRKTTPIGKIRSTPTMRVNALERERDTLRRFAKVALIYRNRGMTGDRAATKQEVEEWAEAFYTACDEVRAALAEVSEIIMKGARSTLITDEGGLVLGIVVNLSRLIAEGKGGSCLELCAAYSAKRRLCEECDHIHDSDRWAYVTAWLERMRLEVGGFRWVPRNDGFSVRPHLEPAEPGSSGSWVGAYWSEPW